MRKGRALYVAPPDAAPFPRPLLRRFEGWHAPHTLGDAIYEDVSARGGEGVPGSEQGRAEQGSAGSGPACLASNYTSRGSPPPTLPHHHHHHTRARAHICT